MKSTEERPTQKTIFLPEWENKKLRKILILVKFGLIFLLCALELGVSAQTSLQTKVITKSQVKTAKIN